MLLTLQKQIIEKMKSIYENNDKVANLKIKTVQGIGWSGISQIIRLILQFGIIAVLARLLTPNDFGLLAMVAVFANFVLIFRDFGLTAALIQRKELVEGHLSSSFWINVVTGFVLTLSLVLLSSAIASFYNESRLIPIVVVLASTFSISSFGIVQAALLAKELNFKPLAIIEILAVIISGIIAVILAFCGFGVWSLVWQSVISSFVIVVMLWCFSVWKPKFLFKWSRVKELLDFGLNLTGFNFVNYFNRNFDNLLIGKFLGSAPLGFYNLAYQLLLFPLSNISQVIGRVMFPSFSIIKDDKKRICDIYIKAASYIAAVTFPLMIGLLVTAPQFIRVIFGPQWDRSIFLVQIFALVGLIQSIGSTVGWIYQSQGRTDIMFRWVVFTVIINVVAFVLGLKWNIEGVTIAYLIATLLLAYPNLAIPFKLIDLKVGYFIMQFKSIILATVGMGGIVFILRFFMENVKASDLITLMACVFSGIVSYMGILFMLNKGLYRGVFHLIKQLKPSFSN